MLMVEASIAEGRVRGFESYFWIRFQRHINQSTYFSVCRSDKWRRLASNPFTFLHRLPSFEPFDLCSLSTLAKTESKDAATCQAGQRRFDVAVAVERGSGWSPVWRPLVRVRLLNEPPQCRRLFLLQSLSAQQNLVSIYHCFAYRLVTLTFFQVLEK